MSSTAGQEWPPGSWYHFFRYFEKISGGGQERLIAFPTIIGSVLPLSTAVHTPPPLTDINFVASMPHRGNIF